jgi:phosphoglycolate phosphatase-like HAD superfamily hydrolase
MHVCLFDIDGTLLSSSGAGRLAMDAALLAEFGIETRIVPSDIAGRTDRSIATNHFKKHGVADTDENWQRFIGGYLRHLPDSLVKNAGRLLPGIATILDHLAGQSTVAVGLLTGNVAAGARIKLGHCGIDHHFSFGAYGDRHQTRDEVAHEALACVRRHLGHDVPGERIWVIGDTPSDVRCARAIGAQAVAVATGLYTLKDLEGESPDLLLADLSDPQPLLTRCLP